MPGAEGMMRSHMLRSREQGFTLIELLIIIGILAVAAAIAIPGFSTWFPNYQLRAAARDAHSNILRAKMAAIKRNVNCTVTFNQAIGAETFDLLVYVDPNSNCEYEAGEEILARVRWSDYGNVSYDLTQGGGDGLSFIDNDDGNPSIAFRPNGLPINNAGGLGMGTVFLVNTNNRTASVVVSSAGNVRIN